jgi:predicted amidophosphoribosyltransferase
MELFCKHCGSEYTWVNKDDPGTCWSCQKPLEVQKRRPAKIVEAPAVAASTHPAPAAEEAQR